MKRKSFEIRLGYLGVIGLLGLLLSGAAQAAVSPTVLFPSVGTWEALYAWRKAECLQKGDRVLVVLENEQYGQGSLQLVMSYSGLKNGDFQTPDQALVSSLKFTDRQDIDWELGPDSQCEFKVSQFKASSKGDLQGFELELHCKALRPDRGSRTRPIHIVAPNPISCHFSKK